MKLTLVLAQQLVDVRKTNPSMVLPGNAVVRTGKRGWPGGDINILRSMVKTWLQICSQYERRRLNSSSSDRDGYQRRGRW